MDSDLMGVSPGKKPGYMHRPRYVELAIARERQGNLVTFALRESRMARRNSRQIPGCLSGQSDHSGVLWPRMP